MDEDTCSRPLPGVVDHPAYFDTGAREHTRVVFFCVIRYPHLAGLLPMMPPLTQSAGMGPCATMRL